MVRVVGVRFKKAGKVYYFDPAELPIAAGAKVVVETARGVEYGDVAVGPKDVADEQVVQPLKKVLRIGTDRDAHTAEENRRKEKEAFGLAQRKIESHGLDMNLVDVEYTFDGSKNIFYFTAEGRVDFRDLVRDLASVFRTRIEMRQIGVRDEAKLLGGIGPCGRILCCTSFLGDFAPVSIRMAKDQNLSLNPSKISGLCGRLMCCLRYEQETYEAAKKDPTLSPGYMPPVVVGSEPAPGDVNALNDQPREMARVKSNQGGMGVPMPPPGSPSGDKPGRPDQPRLQGGPRPQTQDRPPGRPLQNPGKPDGQPRVQASPRREQEQGERPAQPGGQDRRQQPTRGQQQKPQRPQGSGEKQPQQQQQQPRRGNPQGQQVQGERPQGERPVPEKQPGERLQAGTAQGERQERPPGERGHRHRHRGNRPKGGEKPPSGPTTQS